MDFLTMQECAARSARLGRIRDVLDWRSSSFFKKTFTFLYQSGEMDAHRVATWLAHILRGFDEALL